MANSMVLLLLLGFLTGYIKGFQVQVMVGGSYVLAFIFSWLITGINLATILLAVEYGWDSLIPLGIGGSCGVVLSMYVYRKRKARCNDSK